MLAGEMMAEDMMAEDMGDPLLRVGLRSFEDCRHDAQTALSEIASKISGERTEIRPHNDTEVERLRRCGPHLLEPGLGGERVILPAQFPEAGARDRLARRCGVQEKA